MENKRFVVLNICGITVTATIQVIYQCYVTPQTNSKSGRISYDRIIFKIQCERLTHKSNNMIFYNNKNDARKREIGKKENNLIVYHLGPSRKHLISALFRES